MACGFGREHCREARADCSDSDNVIERGNKFRLKTEFNRAQRARRSASAGLRVPGFLRASSCVASAYQRAALPTPPVLLR